MINWQITRFIFLHLYLKEKKSLWKFSRCSVTKKCPTLCNPMGCKTPGFPVHHYQSEFAKLMSIVSMTPPNHLIFCCPLLFLPSIFPSIRVWKRVSSSHQVAKILEFQLQHQSFPMNIQGWFPLGWTGLISLQSKESSPAPKSESINPLVFNLLWKLRDLGKKKHSHSVSVWLCPSHPRPQLWLNSQRRLMR